MLTSLLQINNLKKYFPIRKGVMGKVVNHVKAVDGVSLQIQKGETLGLAGESGCGKSTLGRVLMRVIDGGDGEANFDGSDNLLTMGEREFHPFRRKMQMIFQDPYSSLNPRLTAGSIIHEPVKIHMPNLSKQGRIEKVLRLMKSVGLNEDHYNRYPHQFSGGQRQRIGIARALAVEPQLIIADEAVSALDVSIQAQIINLMMDLKEEFGLSYLFIAHDLSVVRHISDRVAVMYLGKIVELATRDALFNTPKHPYTLALLEAVPEPDPTKQKTRTLLEGEVPNPVDPPSGCRFHPRCQYCFSPCMTHEPKTVTIDSHEVACHLYDPQFNQKIPSTIHVVPIPQTQAAV